MLEAHGLQVWLALSDNKTHIKHRETVTGMENGVYTIKTEVLKFGLPEGPTTNPRFGSNAMHAWCRVLSFTPSGVEVLESETYMDRDIPATQSRSTGRYHLKDGVLRKPRVSRSDPDSRGMGSIRLVIHQAEGKIDAICTGEKDEVDIDFKPDKPWMAFEFVFKWTGHTIRKDSPAGSRLSGAPTKNKTRRNINTAEPYATGITGSARSRMRMRKEPSRIKSEPDADDDHEPVVSRDIHLSRKSARGQKDYPTPSSSRPKRPLHRIRDHSIISISSDSDEGVPEKGAGKDSHPSGAILFVPSLGITPCNVHARPYSSDEASTDVRIQAREEAKAELEHELQAEIELETTEYKKRAEIQRKKNEKRRALIASLDRESSLSLPRSA